MNLLLKRHYPVILLLIFVLAVIIIFLGDQRVIAYTTQAITRVESLESIEGIDYQNEVALFDDDLVHSIQVVMSGEEYDEMITTYQQTGLKEYFHADVIIDGVQVNNVGIRLKGNASLRTALGGQIEGMRGGEEREEFGRLPGAGEPPEMPIDGQQSELQEDGVQPELPPEGEFPAMPGGFERPEVPEGFQPPGGRQGFQGGGMHNMGAAASGEVKIPFLIKFDEFVDGQTYQGYERIAVRTYGITPDAAMMEEPVTNDIVRLVGLPATQTAFTGFQMNDNQEQLYVISEIIDEHYLAKYFDNAYGVLYKAEVGSTLSYQGDEPSAYAKDFSQETRVNDADLAPLIAFMRFLDQADDEMFETQLPEYLDVESFATYLAVNALLVNTDSIIGMNNNYYLYYDDVAERFTLLMWDANESFGGLGGARSSDYDLYFTSTVQGFRGPGGGENALVERFMANETFRALYEEKLVEVYEKAFLDGAIVEDIERYAQLIRSTSGERALVEMDAYNQAVENLLSFVNSRTEYLRSTDLLAE